MPSKTVAKQLHFHIVEGSHCITDFRTNQPFGIGRPPSGIATLNKSSMNDTTALRNEAQSRRDNCELIAFVRRHPAARRPLGA